MLIKAVNKYLDIRHAAGFEMDVPGYLLRSFARFATKRKELHISTQTAIQWASLAPSLSQRRRRLHEVIRLARHLIAEDPHHQIPPGDVFGPKPKRRVPYIFSNKDICSLVREAYKLGPSGSLRPYTYATLLPPGFVYPKHWLFVCIILREMAWSFGKPSLKKADWFPSMILLKRD